VNKFIDSDIDFMLVIKLVVDLNSYYLQLTD